MSDLLRIGAQGVASYRGALSTIGENVANAQTEGYSRRDVSLRDTAIVGNSLLASRTGLIGGVRIAAVTRASNAFLEADIRLAAGEAAGAGALARWLGATENGLDGVGLGGALTDVYATADQLAGDPGSGMGRQALLASIDAAADAFNAAAGALARVRGAIGDEARSAAQHANADLAALSDLNRSLLRATPGSSAHAALLDQRDRTLESLSATLGIETSFEPRGTVTVRLAGADTAPPLLSGQTRAIVAADTAADGRVILTLTADGETTPFAARGGTLGGLVEASVAVADRQRALDAVAADFAAALNHWSAGGFDADGAAGQPLLSGSDASTIRAAVTDPAKVPAASGAAANGNLLALAARRDDDGVETRAQALIDTLAQQLATTRTREAALMARHEAAVTARADLAGVDLDREAAELLRYQQAYDASSRVIQVARETLQTILAIF